MMIIILIIAACIQVYAFIFLLKILNKVKKTLKFHAEFNKTVECYMKSHTADHQIWQDSIGGDIQTLKSKQDYIKQQFEEQQNYNNEDTRHLKREQFSIRADMKSLKRLITKEIP